MELKEIFDKLLEDIISQFSTIDQKINTLRNQLITIYTNVETTLEKARKDGLEAMNSKEVRNDQKLAKFIEVYNATNNTVAQKIPDGITKEELRTGTAESHHKIEFKDFDTTGAEKDDDKYEITSVGHNVNIYNQPFTGE